MITNEREIISALKRCELFRSIPTEQLTRLIDQITSSAAARGECIYRCGKRTPGVYVIASGRIMLSVGTADATKVVGLIAPGGHIGLAATLLGSPETVAADALVDSELLLIPGAALLASAGENAGLALHVAAALGRQVQSLTADIETFALHSGRKRVADYLTRIAASHGAVRHPVALPAKKSIIASRLGLTPEYFSRMLHELIAGGAIAVNGRQITILDPMRLRDTSH